MICLINSFHLISFAGIPKFILISVHDYNLPSFLLSSGYFTGKRKAESEVLSKYPNSGTLFMRFLHRFTSSRDTSEVLITKNK